MAGSSLATETTELKNPSRACLRQNVDYAQFAISARLDFTTNTFQADADAIALYFPDDFIPVGTLVAYIGASAGTSYDGLWVPYLPNIAVDNGEGTATGMVFEPIYINRDQFGVIQQTGATGAVLPANAPVQVLASKMPQYNDHTAYAGGSGSSAAVTQADLPAGFQDLEALGVTNLGGL